MVSEKRCQSCHRPVEDSATRCSFCGEPLLALLPSHSTVPIEPSKVEHMTQMSPAEELIRRHAGMFVFQIMGHDQPLLTHIHPRITIGRFSPGETPPTVDLGPYSASTLGVSRQHAVIATSEKGYTLQDLNSTNGTWVNERKLAPNETVPINNGDMLRFGQLACYTYFQPPSTKTAVLAISFTMISSSEEAIRLTPRSLLTAVSPYLMAISGLQMVVNEARQSPQTDVIVESIQFDASKSSVRIALNNAPDGIRIVLGSIARWRLDHREQLKYIWTKPGAVTAKLETEQAGLPPTTHTDRLREELTTAELKLAQDICAEIMPNRPPEIQRQYIAQLRGHLHVLATSPYSILP